jgi:two-component system nitrogen regulation response regulator GlnG
MVASKEITKEDLPNEFLTPKTTVTTTRNSNENWEQALTTYANKCLQQGAERLLDEITPRYERIMIKAALKQTGGKKKEASELLGLGRNTLSRKMKELEI